MHARELLELGAVVALHGPIFTEAAGSWPAGTIEQYWTASKCRLDRWSRTLRPWADVQSLSREATAALWHRGRATVEEILVSEVLTRTWTAAAAAYDQKRGQAEIEPVAWTVFVGHQEARHRALRLIVDAPAVDMTEAVELNRLRRRLERWCDLLLAYLSPYTDVGLLAFEQDRVEDFAADLPASDAWGSDLAWQLMFASLRASLQAYAGRRTLNGDLNRAIAGSIVGCLREELFDSTGLLKSLWVERIARTTDDTQLMIDELLRMDATGVVERPQAFRRQ